MSCILATAEMRGSTGIGPPGDMDRQPEEDMRVKRVSNESSSWHVGRDGTLDMRPSPLDRKELAQLNARYTWGEVAGIGTAYRSNCAYPTETRIANEIK
jgi:hypothetical protein